MPEASISAAGLCIDFPISRRRHEGKAIDSGANSVGGRFIEQHGAHYLRAISKVDLNAVSGERVGIWGRNGSGKTTFLKALRGVYPPSEGTLEVQGSIQSFFNLSFGLNDDATGYENIMLRGVLMGAKPSKIRELMPEIAEFSELGPYLEMPVRSYSAGMRMRLAFSVASALPADILLMDEWLSVGDVDFRRKAAAKLKAVVQSSKILVITSHNRSILESVCTRLITLDGGKVASDELLTKHYDQVPFYDPESD